MPAGVKPERILRELAELWTGLAQPEHGPSTSAGVLRACAMTLIVAAENEADAQAASGVVAELMHDHPSRAIALKPSSAGELDARVYAQCWMPFGSRQQICCEQIEIAAAADRLGDVPGLMFGLLAPDLPVVLWCRGPRWFGEEHFGELLDLVHKLIVDTEMFGSALEAFDLIAKLRADGHRVADLTWSRLTGWREIVAHALQAESDIEKARQGSTLVVQGGGPAALYLGAWMARALPGKELVIEPSTDGAIRSIRLDSVSFTLLDGATVEVKCGGGAHTSILPRADTEEAMREELSISMRDTVYEQLFDAAHELARKG